MFDTLEVLILNVSVYSLTVLTRFASLNVYEKLFGGSLGETWSDDEISRLGADMMLMAVGILLGLLVQKQRTFTPLVFLVIVISFGLFLWAYMEFLSLRGRKLKQIMNEKTLKARFYLNLLLGWLGLWGAATLGMKIN